MASRGAGFVCRGAAHKFLLAKEKALSIVRNQISTVVTNWSVVCDEATLSDADRRYLWRKQFLNGLAFEGLEDVLAPEIDVVGKFDPNS